VKTVIYNSQVPSHKPLRLYTPSDICTTFEVRKAMWENAVNIYQRLKNRR